MDTATDRISWFPVPDEADLPPDLQGLFRKARERIGFVPNVFRTYAFRPERLSAWFAHFRLLHEETPGLSAAEREMIAVVVSMANGCLYCLVAHGAALREAWGDPVMADRITLDWRRAEGLSDRQRAICAMAERLTTAPLECTEAELDELRGHGLSDTDAWDVIEVAAMYNFTNRVALATGQMPEPGVPRARALEARGQPAREPRRERLDEAGRDVAAASAGCAAQPPAIRARRIRPPRGACTREATPASVEVRVSSGAKTPGPPSTTITRSSAVCLPWPRRRRRAGGRP